MAPFDAREFLERPFLFCLFLGGEGAGGWFPKWGFSVLLVFKFSTAFRGEPLTFP